MKTLQKTILACAIASLSGLAIGEEYPLRLPSSASPDLSRPARHGCSLRDVVGKWIFVTSIGRQMLPGMPPEKDMTALGTWNVSSDGAMSGSFDVTVQDTFFMPEIGYAGTVTVNPDCTGTISFVTELGSVRTDTLAIVGRGEILGMSQDPFNLWTYQVRRVGSYGPQARRGL